SVQRVYTEDVAGVGWEQVVFRQTWQTYSQCETSALGWASPKTPNHEGDGAFCHVEWAIHEVPWDPSRRRWIGRKPIDSPPPTRSGKTRGDPPVSRRWQALMEAP